MMNSDRVTWLPWRLLYGTTTVTKTRFDIISSLLVLSMFILITHISPGQVPYYGQTGLNAGVMLMDIQAMKQWQPGWSRTCMAVADRFKQDIKLADQVCGEQGNFLMFLTGLSRTPCIHVTGLGHPEHPIPPLPRHPVRLAMRLELPHVAVQPGGEHLRPCCGDRGVPAARVRHGVCQGVSPVTTSHPQNTAAADRS